ncbi:MAG: ROK family protein, partial [Bacteroidetes bacterium]|nr:ROK family protein [Bacteroidota bacterium]
LINAFSPEIVILGGGISKAGEALLGPLKDFLGIYEWETGGFRTPIVLAESGSDAGAVGAGIFASYM